MTRAANGTRQDVCHLAKTLREYHTRRNPSIVSLSQLTTPGSFLGRPTKSARRVGNAVRLGSPDRINLTLKVNISGTRLRPLSGARHGLSLVQAYFPKV